MLRIFSNKARFSSQTPLPNVYIYALVDPRTSEIRYIGKSVRPTERLANHCNERANSWRNHWIQQLIALGLRPQLNILETLDVGVDWQASERRWIAHGKEQGWRLVNCTDGGDGVSGLPAEVRARMALTWTGRKHRPESLARIGNASRGRKHSDASKTHMRALMTGRKITWADKVSRSLCKLTVEQVADVKRLLAEGAKQRDIAAHYGVHQGTIHNIHRGKGYKWLTSETV